LRQELDAGEAEAIALTLETQAELLLMDERVGREVARHLGLRYTGLIGVLVEAKHKGVLSVVTPQLDELRNIAGFRISDALYVRVLQDEREES
jgi:predicted nucleic acid-binding protein